MSNKHTINLSSGKTAVVTGLEFDRISQFSTEATCAGFDRVVLSDLLIVEDMNELSEVLNNQDATELYAALYLLATEESRQWQEERAELNRFLARL